MSRYHATLSRWKRPEYTGSNRCLPCTVVNILIAVGLAAVSAIVFSMGGSQWGLPVGASILVGSLLLLSFNGYLIPGTPSLTKRYLPRRVLAAFGKADGLRTDDRFDPDAELRTAGLVVDGRDDLRLLSEFERAWWSVIDDIGTADMSVEAEILQRLAVLGGFDVNDLELVDGPRSFQAWYADELVANWESRAACIADVAAADIISEYDSWWDDRPLAMQAELLGALRLFLERCPVCHGSVALSHEVVSSCCYDYDVVVTTCGDCNARLFEVEVADDFPVGGE